MGLQRVRHSGAGVRPSVRLWYVLKHQSSMAAYKAAMAVSDWIESQGPGSSWGGVDPASEQISKSNRATS
jgi:hypothetical protein